MKWFSQVGALLNFNLKSLPQRKGAALAAIFGIAGVVAVLVGVLSIAQGFERTMTVAGSSDTAIVLRSGADSEMTSVLGRIMPRTESYGAGARELVGRLAEARYAITATGGTVQVYEVAPGTAATE